MLDSTQHLVDSRAIPMLKGYEQGLNALRIQGDEKEQIRREINDARFELQFLPFGMSDYIGMTQDESESGLAGYKLTIGRLRARAQEAVKHSPDSPDARNMLDVAIKLGTMFNPEDILHSASG